jgi:cysteine desulfurase/selenocysteine lyase
LKDTEEYRSEFPITERYTFLNHAAVASPPMRAVTAVTAVMEESSRCGIDCYSGWMERIQAVRHLFASLIGAQPEEIAFVGNTSTGLSAVAGGLKWKSGDSVMVPEPDFPANIYPWLNLEKYGVRVIFIKRREGRLTLEDVRNALVPGTRLLSVSSVDFFTGYCCDLEELGSFCREKGLLFCVDGIQSLGVIPVDVGQWGVHFLAAGGHKWLLGPMGCGGLFISKEVNHLVHPERVGWKSVKNEGDFFRIHFDLKEDASRFEPGTMNLLAIYGLGVALELILEVGVERIRERILGLNDLFVEGLLKRNLRVLTPLGEKERSGILSFVPSLDPQRLFQHLMEEKVMVSERNGLIRLSPHFYNNDQDVERFFEAMDQVVSL